MGDGYSDRAAVAHRFRSESRARSPGAFVDLNAADIRKLSRVIMEDRGLNPVDVVTEVKVNAGSSADSGKTASRPQPIATEAIDGVIAAGGNVGAVNFELHLSMRTRIVAVAEANVNY